MRGDNLCVGCRYRWKKFGELCETCDSFRRLFTTGIEESTRQMGSDAVYRVSSVGREIRDGGRIFEVVWDGT